MTLVVLSVNLALSAQNAILKKYGIFNLTPLIAILNKHSK
jgi:hypothetical protein